MISVGGGSRFTELTENSFQSILQSHSYITRGNRRLSLAALPGLPAASGGVKLPLLADTRSDFSHCNTGNLVNTPVYVNKTTPCR